MILSEHDCAQISFTEHKFINHDFCPSPDTARG